MGLKRAAWLLSSIAFVCCLHFHLFPLLGDERSKLWYETRRSSSFLLLRVSTRSRLLSVALIYSSVSTNRSSSRLISTFWPANTLQWCYMASISPLRSAFWLLIEAFAKRRSSYSRLAAARPSSALRFLPSKS